MVSRISSFPHTPINEGSTTVSVARSYNGMSVEKLTQPERHITDARMTANSVDRMPMS
jgi:hypothetical protein